MDEQTEFDDYEIRVFDLNRRIERAFGELASDEVEILGASYGAVETRMFEVLDVGRSRIALMDLYEDVEFFPVELPAEVITRIDRGDVFLMTIGLKKRTWSVLWMSPAYASIPI